MANALLSSISAKAPSSLEPTTPMLSWIESHLSFLIHQFKIPNSCARALLINACLPIQADYTLLASSAQDFPKKQLFLPQLFLRLSELCFSQAFDVIIFNATPYLAHDLTPILKNIFGCLRPGGRLYVAALGHGSFFEWRSLLSKRPIPQEHAYINHHLFTNWCAASQVLHTEETWTTMHYSKIDQDTSPILSYIPDEQAQPILANAYPDVFPCTYHVLYGVFEKNTDLRDE